MWISLDSFYLIFSGFQGSRCQFLSPDLDVFSHYFFKYAFCPFFFSASQTSIIHAFVCLMVSHRCLKLSSLLCNSFLCLVLWLNEFHCTECLHWPILLIDLVCYWSPLFQFFTSVIIVFSSDLCLVLYYMLYLFVEILTFNKGYPDLSGHHYIIKLSMKQIIDLHFIMISFFRLRFLCPLFGPFLHFP